MQTKNEQEPNKFDLLIAGLAGFFTLAAISGIFLYLFLKPAATTVVVASMVAGTAAVASSFPIIPAIVLGIGALVLCGIFAYMLYRCCFKKDIGNASYDDCYHTGASSYLIIDPLRDYSIYGPSDSHSFHSDSNTYYHPSEVGHHHSHPSNNFFPTSEENHSGPNVHHHPSQTDLAGNHYGQNVHGHG